MRGLTRPRIFCPPARLPSPTPFSCYSATPLSRSLATPLSRKPATGPSGYSTIRPGYPSIGQSNYPAIRPSSSSGPLWVSPPIHRLCRRDGAIGLPDRRRPRHPDRNPRDSSNRPILPPRAIASSFPAASMGINSTKLTGPFYLRVQTPHIPDRRRPRHIIYRIRPTAQPTHSHLRGISHTPGRHKPALYIRRATIPAGPFAPPAMGHPVRLL